MAAVCVGASAALAADSCQRSNGTALRDAHWHASGAAHPLVGAVLKDGKLVTAEVGICARSPLHQLIAEVWGTINLGGVVLLGEVHDNPEHHEVRGDMLWPRLKGVNESRELRPAAVFEHIRTTQQPQIDQFYHMASRSRRLWRASDLLRVLNWKETGWPAAEMFYPLFNDALWAKLPIHPGNPDRARMRTLIKDRSDANADEAALLKLVDALPPDSVASLDTELEGSHCGAMPKSAIPAMSLAQRYIDAHLAQAAVTAATKHGGAFVVAGNGHVRSDRGVPWYIRQFAPGKPVTAVMLIEVQDGVTDPAAYLWRRDGGGSTADYALFTPRQARSDPCEKLRQNKP